LSVILNSGISLSTPPLEKKLLANMHVRTQKREIQQRGKTGYAYAEIWQQLLSAAFYLCNVCTTFIPNILVKIHNILHSRQLYYMYVSTLIVSCSIFFFVF
jgi:hypothetical protein